MGNETGRRPSHLQSLAARHWPSAVVLASQLAAAVVHGVVKALEEGGGDAPADPFQILLVRMLVTGAGCSLYLWRRRAPEFPWGPREVRPLLLGRAAAGVLGAGGMYYSIRYLTLSQATALNFLAPMGAMLLSTYVDHGTLTLVDGAGAAVALAGVLMVVQPGGTFRAGEATTQQPPPAPTPHAKWKGTACGLVGVLGTTMALAAMRRIGARAHPLTVVHHFAWLVVAVAAAALVAAGRPAWPTGAAAWGGLALVGVLGGLMEFLLTAGIAGDASSAATLMIYSQVLWALALDRLLWRVDVDAWTLAGAAGVVGSLAVVSLAKEVPPGALRRLRRRGDERHDALPVHVLDEGGVTVHEIDLDGLYDSEHGPGLS